MSIEQFIIAIKEERFVEAHELLEDEWRDYKKNNEKLKAKAVQGLINGATALALFRKNRYEAYEKIWKVYEKYKNLLDELESEKYYEASEILELKRNTIVN
ncbi:DUF309 domain-containing protein [Arcobacter sp.]|uniref:DUF309 domain-containing protein n=1 Tax=Arcobacter sp. TaxID=1872629 RepID=UPI003D113CDD